MPVSLVLADDHALVLASYRALLSTQPGFVVSAAVEDGSEVGAAVLKHRPDVLVLDLKMHKRHGLDALAEVRVKAPDVRVVVCSMYDTPGYVLRALRLGALGFVLKQAPASELVHAISAAAEGQSYLSPPLSLERVRNYERSEEGEALDRYETLTERERAVFRLVVDGLSNAAIARRLGIGQRTVEAHRLHMMRKMGADTTTGLVRYATLSGLALGHD
jgi:DNA-binding NarL/FixJ family response regulator